MEAAVRSGAGRFFGTVLLVAPAVAVGALVSLVCSWVLLTRLWAGALGEVVLAVAFAAYLLMLPLGYAIGEAIGSHACATGTGTECDITTLYGYLGALAALGIVPIVLVAVDLWRQNFCSSSPESTL